MSARAYDEWAKNCPMARDQIVVAGTKRTRKKSSKYADDDDDAEPSTIAATINKRKTPEKSNEGGTDDEAPTKQPSQERKAKSLVHRWIAFPFGISTNEKDNLVAEDILIERDVIILANVKIGSRANATTVVRPFRVIMLYEKYFNKWFGSKPLTKRWKMEAKPYKVEIRMLQKNELEEYCDVDLYDPDYKKNEICKNITDDMILDVIGKLHAVG